MGLSSQSLLPLCWDMHTALGFSPSRGRRVLPSGTPALSLPAAVLASEATLAFLCLLWPVLV